MLPPGAPLLSPTDQKTHRLKMVSVGVNLSKVVQPRNCWKCTKSRTEVKSRQGLGWGIFLTWFVLSTTKGDLFGATFNTQRLYIPHDERFQKIPSCSPRNSFPAPYQGSVMNLYNIDRFSFTVVCECLW